MYHIEICDILKRNIILKGTFLFVENINVFESKFGRLQCDPYFTEYVELFKCMVLARESKRDLLVEFSKI